MVTLTESAAEKIKALMEKESKAGYHFRMRVIGGGCSGLQYKMEFDREALDGDAVAEQHGVKVLVDPTSALYLTGTEVDYVDSLTGQGFQIKNPQAKGSCGCGESFSA